MEFPKQIETFRLHDVFGNWKYKGQEYVSAHYIRLGSRMDLYIRTIGDQEGKVRYEIQVKDSYISHIESLEKAIEIARAVIIENNSFIDR